MGFICHVKERAEQTAPKGQRGSPHPAILHSRVLSSCQAQQSSPRGQAGAPLQAGSGLGPSQPPGPAEPPAWGARNCPVGGAGSGSILGSRGPHPTPGAARGAEPQSTPFLSKTPGHGVCCQAGCEQPQLSTHRGWQSSAGGSTYLLLPPRRKHSPQASQFEYAPTLPTSGREEHQKPGQGLASGARSPRALEAEATHPHRNPLLGGLFPPQPSARAPLPLPPLHSPSDLIKQHRQHTLLSCFHPRPVVSTHTPIIFSHPHNILPPAAGCAVQDLGRVKPPAVQPSRQQTGNFRGTKPFRDKSSLCSS